MTTITTEHSLERVRDKCETVLAEKREKAWGFKTSSKNEGIPSEINVNPDDTNRHNYILREADPNSSSLCETK
jgi:hypothetical protein